MNDSATDWFGPDSATFGDRLAGAREHAGMTPAQLAKRLGVKKSTLISWEEDLSEPRANRLSILAGLLNVSIMWLLTGEGDGMTGPVGETADPDVSEVLAELRAIRGEMRTLMERTGRAEKRLRALVARPQA